MPSSGASSPGDIQGRWSRRPRGSSAQWHSGTKDRLGVRYGLRSGPARNLLCLLREPSLVKARPPSGHVLLTGQQGSSREAGQHHPGVAVEGTWTSLAATLPQPFCSEEEEVIKGPAPRGWGHAHTDPLDGQLCPLQAPQAFPNPNPNQASLAQPHPQHLYSKDPPRVGNSQSMIISGTILTLC